MQAAQESAKRIAQEQHELDAREAQLVQDEANLKELQAMLQAQRSELHHKQQHLQVGCLACLVLVSHCVVSSQSTKPACSLFDLPSSTKPFGCMACQIQLVWGGLEGLEER